ncbi:MAG: hypothetical protein NVS2B12_09140 [Ktedonobacteraceae bacterium]
MQLDASIQQIVQTYMRIANGDFDARVPLNQDNVLWQVAGSLNTPASVRNNNESKATNIT